MTTEQQARFTKLIARFSELHPDWRIGQIIANVAWWARGPSNEAIWDVTDHEFLAAGEAHLAKNGTNSEATHPLRAEGGPEAMVTAHPTQ